MVVSTTEALWPDLLGVLLQMGHGLTRSRPVSSCRSPSRLACMSTHFRTIRDGAGVLMVFRPSSKANK